MLTLLARYFQKGAFGPPTVRVISFEARDPDNADDIFSNGDEIKIDFNIPTNKADLPDDKITRTQLEKVFLFSMSLGLDFVGRWVTSSSLRISILNSTKDPSSQLPHPPYVGKYFGSPGLTFTMLESGEIFELHGSKLLFKKIKPSILVFGLCMFRI